MVVRTSGVRGISSVAAAAVGGGVGFSFFGSGSADAGRRGGDENRFGSTESGENGERFRFALAMTESTSNSANAASNALSSSAATPTAATDATTAVGVGVGLVATGTGTGSVRFASGV